MPTKTRKAPVAKKNAKVKDLPAGKKKVKGGAVMNHEEQYITKRP
jgi:hypothetical protein